MSKSQSPMWERIIEQQTRGQVREEEMTDAEKKERERLVKGMKKSADDFETRYPGRGKEVMYATATKRAMEEAQQRPVRIGDTVKIAAPPPGNMWYRAGKSDAALSGVVLHINGNLVDIKLPNNRVIRAAMNKVSLQEADAESDYETYFRGMLKKHGYDSPADIPDDKKDDFFNAVDKGYRAKNESRLAEAPAPILKSGTRVKVPHRGKMVPGKVVRYDNGMPYFSPYYIVDVGEYASVLVPAHVIAASGLTEATDTPKFAVVATDDPRPAYQRGPGSTPVKKVVWQMWGLDKKEVGLAAKVARQDHPNAVISVENASGTVVKVFKPGQAITESILTEVEQEPLDFEYLATFGFTKKNLLRQYRENEAENRHADNALFLTMLFGTPQEQELASKLKRIAMRDGGLDVAKYQPLIKKVNSLHSKYYQKLMSLQESALAPRASLIEEHDDLGMMKGQLMSILDRAEALLTRVSENPPSDVEAWVQAKVTDADTAITSLHDYFKYSDDQNPEFAECCGNRLEDCRCQQDDDTLTEPLAEAELLVKGERPISGVTLPLKKTAALAFASAFIDRPTGATPEAIVNQALAVYFQKNKVPNIVRLRNLGRMLQLVSKMGINWNEELIPPQLVRFVNAAASPTGLPMGESRETPRQVIRRIKEAVQGPTAPSEMSATQRLAQQQKKEKERLAARQQQEKMAAQQRDFQEKQRQQQAAATR